MDRLRDSWAGQPRKAGKPRETAPEGADRRAGMTEVRQGQAPRSLQPVMLMR